MIRLKPLDLQMTAEFRDVRLAALRDTPTAFGSTFAKESLLSEQDWRTRVGQWNGEKSIGLLAADGDVACGIIDAVLQADRPDLVHVFSMWVAPTHRRAGVGKLLMGAVLDWARGRGAWSVRLDVTSNNEPAKAFYLRLGFSFTGITAPYPNDSSLIELEMIYTI